MYTLNENTGNLNKGVYKCSVCNKEVPKDTFSIKRMMFNCNKENCPKNG